MNKTFTGLLFAAVASSLFAQGNQSDYFSVLSTVQTEIADRAQILNGRVGSQGSVNIGSRAVVKHNVEAGSNIELRSWSRVINAISGGPIIKQAGAKVTGLELANYAVHVPSIPAIGPFTPGTKDTTVQKGSTVTLPPGAYRNVIIRCNSTLYLESGTYSVRDFIIEPDVTVRFNVASLTPAVINVSGIMNIESRVKFDLMGSDNNPWLVRINSTQTNDFNLYTDSRLKGIFNIPNARLTMFSRSSLDGALHGKYVRIDTDAILNGINIDTDGDGLIDEWELVGYDADNNGIIDVDLPALGANPLKKDIFIEVDWMQDSLRNQQPPAGAINDVILAFNNAQADNPDGTQGINLHVEMSNEVPFDEDLNPIWTEFDVIKAANFPVARQKTHHYCVIGYRYNGGWSSGISRGIPASDFIVTLNNVNNDRTMFSGTFMHELGHNLNLRHGGVDHEHYKPNFLSIMNYSFQFPHIPNTNGNVLDYSRFSIEDLDENNLNENTGLNVMAGTGSDADLTNYGTNINGRIVNNCAVAIDYNDNGTSNQVNLVQDVNNNGFTSVLRSQNDWRSMTYNGGTVGLGETYVVPGTVTEGSNPFALQCPEMKQ